MALSLLLFCFAHTPLSYSHFICLSLFLLVKHFALLLRKGHINTFYYRCCYIFITSGSPCTLLRSVISIQSLCIFISAPCRHTNITLTTNSVFARDYYVHVHEGENTLAETHPYTPTPAARALPQLLVLMDGSLITTLTLGLLSPRLSPRTCVHVSVCVCVHVSVCVCVRELCADRSSPPTHTAH